MAIPIIGIVLMIVMAGALRSAWMFGVLFVAYAIWAFRLFGRGTTPGKNMLGMTVLDEDGRPAGFGKMFVREWIGKFLSGLVFALGYIWILLDKERQGWHDKLVSTHVVIRA